MALFSYLILYLYGTAGDELQGSDYNRSSGIFYYPDPEFPLFFFSIFQSEAFQYKWHPFAYLRIILQG